MDGTFSWNCLFVYSPRLYADVSIISSVLSGGLGSAGSLFKFVW